MKQAALSRLKLPVRFPARDDSNGRIDPRKMESVHLNLFSTFSTLVLGFPMKNEHPYLVRALTRSLRACLAYLQAANRFQAKSSFNFAAMLC